MKEKKKLIEKCILNSEGRLTDYGLMLLARKDNEAFMALKIDMDTEIENMVRYAVEQCGIKYKYNCSNAEEIRQRMYVRILSVYAEKFKFERYTNSDSFYVDGWRYMKKELLLEEYRKYVMDREEEK